VLLFTAIAMIAYLQESDLALVLDLKLQQLNESGRPHVPSNWQQRSLSRYQQLYREGKCVHLGYRSAQGVVAMAGVLFVNDAPLLSLQARSHGLFIDEYVSQPFRGQGIEGLLRDALLAYLAKRGAVATNTIPPNAARLAACTASNFRL
jgi:GNAT superfamily N-acetyltransferase